MTVPGPDEIHLAFVKVRDCESFALDKPGMLTSFLAMLTERLDMRSLGNLTVRVYGDEPHLSDPGGCTAVDVLSTSHAAIHTWPESQAANITIYSCKGFSPDEVAEMACEFFHGRAEVAKITPDFRPFDNSR